MLESLEGIFGIAYHQDHHILVVLIPVKSYPQVSFPLSIVWDSVIFLEDYHEVLGILFANAIHYKPINYEAARDWVPVVLPESGYGSTLHVALFIKSFSNSSFTSFPDCDCSYIPL